MSPIKSLNSGDSLSRSTGRFCGRVSSPGEQEEFVAQFSQRQFLPRFFQAIPLKCSDEIVGESNDFQVQSVGRKRGSGGLSKREVFAQFTDPRLHASGRKRAVFPSGVISGKKLTMW
jgi:hypothetical protein